MLKKPLSFLKYLIGWPLSVLALFFVFRIIFANTAKFDFDVSSISIPLLILSLVLFVVYFFLRAHLWMMILGDNSKHLSFKENLLYWSTSELKRYIPGNIWSLISRTKSFERETLSKKQVLVFIAHEAIIICLSSLIISLFYLWNFRNNEILKYSVLFFTIISFCIFIFSINLSKLFPKVNKFTRFLNLMLLNNGPFANFKILLFGILTFFVFGLASYLSVVSLFYIDIKNILILISLFNLSFFIGYISLITPMGLGVREAASTAGLAFFILNSFAAISSVFIRIIFIISELLSLFLVIMWNRLNFSLIKRAESFISSHKHELLLFVFVCIYILYFTTASFLRYDNFFTGRFDLGNMDQTVWNTINGRIFQLTDPDGTGIISRLSIHADFILLLLSPLYFIWESPKMLLLLQTVVLSFGALFVYLISKEILKNKNISLVFGTVFLLNPAVGFTNLYDFHPVTLATTFLLAVYYFFLKKKYLWLLVFSVLAGLTKEEVWAIIAIFGLFIIGRAFFEKKKNHIELFLGIMLLLGGAGFAYILIAKVIPFFKGSEHFALSYFSDFGDSPLTIISNILLDPVKTFSTVFEKSRLLFLNQLLSPLGYLSLLSPVFLIFALPDLTINLLSSNPALHQIYYQYSATITPFIFVSGIYSCKIITRYFKKIDFEKLSIYILLCAFISLYLTGPVIGSKKANIDMFSKQLSNRVLVEKFLTSIPKHYSVAATNNLGSHLSQREFIYNIPYGMEKADVVVFLLNDVFAQPSLDAQKIMTASLKNHPDFALIIENGDFIAFKNLKNL